VTHTTRSWPSRLRLILRYVVLSLCRLYALLTTNTEREKGKKDRYNKNLLMCEKYWDAYERNRGKPYKEIEKAICAHWKRGLPDLDPPWWTTKNGPSKGWATFNHVNWAVSLAGCDDYTPTSWSWWHQ
jgi:hypothetical protein